MCVCELAQRREVKRCTSIACPTLGTCVNSMEFIGFDWQTFRAFGYTLVRENRALAHSTNPFARSNVYFDSNSITLLMTILRKETRLCCAETDRNTCPLSNRRMCTLQPQLGIRKAGKQKNKSTMDCERKRASKQMNRYHKDEIPSQKSFVIDIAFMVAIFTSQNIYI